MSLLNAPLVILDLETTGLDCKAQRVTEIALLRIEDGSVVATWQSLINPTIRIPQDNFEFTGISDAMVASAPIFPEVIDLLNGYLADAVVVAHNASFDRGFLAEEFSRADRVFDKQMLCTVELSRLLFPLEKRHNLDSIIYRHNLHVESRHRAMGDVQLVWQWLQKMMQQTDSGELNIALDRAFSKSNRMTLNHPT
ncbi:MAG: 3'-5' exonuclease [Nitrosomonadales bacterium]|nr:3'-5' exonuclease [Nitrosomonadales bacterium]